MIDLTNCKVNPFRTYDGSNGNKICVIYQGENYMVKFPPKKDKLKISYTNSCISEYVASSIYRTLGFDVHDTFLAHYQKNDKPYTVVACKDFCKGNERLTSFAMLKNSCLDSSNNGFGTELQTILDAIDEQNIIDSNIVKERFWDMFIADALLGNFDRHNGNWGFLVTDNSARLAPVYDNGSCLYPQITDEGIKKVLENQDEINNRVFCFPNSAIRLNGKKINYHEFIGSLQNEDCNQALLRIYPRIDMEKIKNIVNQTEEISDIRKEFYCTMLQERYEYLIKEPYLQLQKTIDDPENDDIEYDFDDYEEI